MAEFVNDCPRCGANRITFDLFGDTIVQHAILDYFFEALARCRACNRCSIFSLFSRVENTSYSWNDGSLSQARGSLYSSVEVLGVVPIAGGAPAQPPEALPADVEKCFREGATCLAASCYNAAGAMFRLCLDMATKNLLPTPEAPNGPNRNQRARLFDRLEWLFESGTLPEGLKELAGCVREDGNDAAHDGTLAKADAEDLLDFSRILLERIYTEPARLLQARARREQRRA